MVMKALAIPQFSHFHILTFLQAEETADTGASCLHVASTIPVPGRLASIAVLDVDDVRIGVLNEQERIPALLLVTPLMQTSIDQTCIRQHNHHHQGISINRVAQTAERFLEATPIDGRTGR
jgi:hypothetical protein